MSSLTLVSSNVFCTVYSSSHHESIVTYCTSHWIKHYSMLTHDKILMDVNDLMLTQHYSTSDLLLSKHNISSNTETGRKRKKTK